MTEKELLPRRPGRMDAGERAVVEALLCELEAMPGSLTSAWRSPLAEPLRLELVRTYQALRDCLAVIRRDHG